MEEFEITTNTEQGYQRAKILCIITTRFTQIKGLYIEVYKWVQVLYNAACKPTTNNWNALLSKRA